MFILCRLILKWALLALGLPSLALGQTQPAPIKLAVIEALSGPSAPLGEAAFLNLMWAVERVNARGGVHLPEAGGGQRPLVLERHDSKGQAALALPALRAAIEGGARFVLQGHSSATAAALGAAVDQHNAREPARRVLLLTYTAIDPGSSHEHCSFWQFDFDAQARMRLSAVMAVLKEDRALKRVFLLGQDDGGSQALARELRRQLGASQHHVQLLVPASGRSDRRPALASLAAQVKASGAQHVITSLEGQALARFVRSARSLGFHGQFHALRGNAPGLLSAIGESGIGSVFFVDDWLTNVQTIRSEAFYQSFRERYPLPAQDSPRMRMQLMVEALALALGQAGSAEALAVAQRLEQIEIAIGSQEGFMRAADHQFQQPLVVGVMDRKGEPGVKFDAEGSGYGLRVIRSLTPAEAAQASRCQIRPPRS